MTDEYTPRQEGTYWLFAFALAICGKCGRSMLPVSAKKANYFPRYHRNRIEEQARRAGIRWETSARDKEEHILCDECAITGNITFVCYICKQERQRTDIQETFGEPPDYLCTPCHQTVSAAEWQRIVEELLEQHRYDFNA